MDTRGGGEGWTRGDGLPRQGCAKRAQGWKSPRILSPTPTSDTSLSIETEQREREHVANSS